jgi:protein involved in polysaccharide export with SLBB domain
MFGGTVGIGGAIFAPAQFRYNIQNATLLSVNNESRGIVVKAVGGNESATSGINTKTRNATLAKTNNGTQLQAFNDSPFGKAVIQGLGTRLGAKITYNATKQNNDVCFIHGVGMGKAVDYYLNRPKQSLQHQIGIHNVTQAKMTLAQKAFAKAETSFCKQ